MIVPEEFRIELEDIVSALNTEIISIPLFKFGHTYFGEVVHNFIVVKVDHKYDPSALSAKTFAYGKCILMLDKNCIDCKVPGCGENAIGITVGRHYTFPKKPSFDCAKNKFLS